MPSNRAVSNQASSNVSWLHIRTSWTVLAIALAVTVFGVRVVSSFAQESEEPQETEAADADAAEDEGDDETDPLEEWDTLADRQYAIAKELRDLKAKFGKTTERAKKEEIRDEFEGLISEFRTEIEPRMVKIADEVFSKNSELTMAGEIALELAYEESRFARAVDITDTLWDAGVRNKTIANIGGKSHFAVHNFARCREVFAAADEELDGQSRTMQRLADDYVGYWEAEQSIRETEVAAEGNDRLPRVALTIKGQAIVLELFENEAPNTVANFISLVEQGAYDGIEIHYVDENYLVQTGDLSTREPANDELPTELDYTIACECKQENARRHFRGSLSMALVDSEADTASSEFHITRMPTYWLDKDIRADAVHTVFGRVVSGMDTVDRLDMGSLGIPADRIESARVVFKRDHPYDPEKIVKDDGGDEPDDDGSQDDDDADSTDP